MTVKNIPIVQDPDTLEGQTQQFVPDQTFPETQVRATQPPVIEPAQPVAATPETPQPSKTDEILSRLYAINEPKPTLDLEKQARLQKMGKLNNIGQSINLLTDALSLGLGGKVNRRAPDNVSPALYQQYQNLIDKNKSDLDQWNLRDNAQKRANIGMELQVAWKEKADKLRMDVETAKSETAKVIATQKLKQAEIEQGRKEKDLAEKVRHNKARESAEEKRARIAADKKKGASEFTVSTQSKNYPLSQTDFEYYKGLALQKTPELEKRFPGWFVQVPQRDDYGDAIPGKFTKKLDSRIKDKDLVRAMMEMKEDQDKQKEESGNPAQPTYTYPGAGQPVAAGTQPAKSTPVTKPNPNYDPSKYQRK